MHAYRRPINLLILCQISAVLRLRRKCVLQSKPAELSNLQITDTLSIGPRPTVATALGNIAQASTIYKIYRVRRVLK